MLREDSWTDYYDKIEDVDFDPKTGASKYNTRKELEAALTKAYGWNVNKPGIKEAIDRYFNTNIDESAIRKAKGKKITEDAASRVKAAQEFEARTGISPEDFEAYEDVRQSGVTNMFDFRTVMELSGLSKDMIMKIMKNYTEAKKVYGK